MSTAPRIVTPQEARFDVDRATRVELTYTISTEPERARAAAASALREAASEARGMYDPVKPDCAEWAGWLDSRADAIESGQAVTSSHVNDHGNPIHPPPTTSGDSSVKPACDHLFRSGYGGHCTVPSTVTEDAFCGMPMTAHPGAETPLPADLQEIADLLWESAHGAPPIDRDPIALHFRDHQNAAEGCRLCNLGA